MNEPMFTLHLHPAQGPRRKFVELESRPLAHENPVELYRPVGPPPSPATAG